MIVLELNKIKSLEDIREWMDENLVGKKQATKLTEQSDTAFKQSLRLGHIVPFFEEKDAYGSAKTRLYYKEDLLEYKKNKRQRPTKTAQELDD